MLVHGRWLINICWLSGIPPSSRGPDGGWSRARLSKRWLMFRINPSWSLSLRLCQTNSWGKKVQGKKWIKGKAGKDEDQGKTDFSLSFSLTAYHILLLLPALKQNRGLVLFTEDYCNITGIKKDHSTISPEELIRIVHMLKTFITGIQFVWPLQCIFFSALQKIIFFSFCSLEQRVITGKMKIL